METNFLLAKPFTDHLDKVRILLQRAPQGYDFQVKCAGSTLNYSELIAVNTSCYEGQGLKRSAIDIIEIQNQQERENVLAAISTYYQLVQARVNEAGKISKHDMLYVLNSFNSDQKMAA